MSSACVISPAPDAFASGLLGYLDCQTISLGGQGYAALAAPGSSASLVLGALLTILVASIGYRLLFGETPDVRDGVLAMAKVGIVLALATSWPAYHVLIFDVALRAPADLAAEIGRPAGLPGVTGGLAARMDNVDRDFRILAIRGTGTPTQAEVEQANGVAPPLFANFDSFALGASRLTFLVGGLGAFALVRLSAGFLLALGPLLVIFLLFATTRGLAEGWLRGLVAATLGGAAVAVVLGVELALLEPWLADLAGRRAAGSAIPGVPTALMATTIIFAIATAGLLALVTRIAFGLRLPPGEWLTRHLPVQAVGGTAARERIAAAAFGPATAEPRSRATTIVDGIVAAQRREEQAFAGGGTSSSSLTTPAGPSGAQGLSIDAAPLGRGFRPRTLRRVSGSAAARDRH